MVVYISGPITGRPDGNKPSFDAAECRLWGEGHEPLNPHVLCKAYPHHTTWDQYMRVDLMALLAADRVLALPGWKESRGAVIECRLASELGIPVIEEADWGNPRTKTDASNKPVCVLTQISTKDLVDELVSRTGVSENWVKLAEPYAVVVGGGREQSLGPARILVVTE